MGAGDQADSGADDVRRGSFRNWDAYFAFLLLLTLVTITSLPEDDRGDLKRTVAAGLLVALGVAYAALGRRAIRLPRRPGPGTYPFAAIMVALFVPAVLLAPAAATIMGALAPLSFLLLRPVRAAALAGLLTIGVIVGILRETGFPWVLTVSIMLGLLACDALLGWIDRTARQSAERAELIDELRRTRADLAEISRERGALNERERLAREIHDTLTQGLTSIGMLVQAAMADLGPDPRLELAARTARDHLAETRAVVAALAPPSLTTGSLVEALRRLVDDSALPARLATDGPPRSLGTNVETVLLRVAQEALANVRRHASCAREVAVSVEFTPDDARLTVTDDGPGFDLARTSGGYGLGGMRTRVEQAGGELVLTSAPGEGTTVEAVIPCPARTTAPSA
ncbi:sensor histidine kinase [Actinomadura harenae]|uniref:Oxygen sensor histidine kinase NreB n=2 Tax=Actinomadura harenae TaxID=2483351 RepID=A0A3M2M1I0_9ACTN|nr:sensor histidine kinase [Actinomadura harenae]RMI43477.1 sensor histidine kinase [Actinomadura harenae]